MPDGSSQLTPQEVLRIASLAKLDLAPQAAIEFQTRLNAVVGYVSKLSSVDVTSIAPLTAAPTTFDSLRPDIAVHPATLESPSLLPTSALINIAPASDGPFVRVPKVIE